MTPNQEDSPISASARFLSPRIRLLSDAIADDPGAVTAFWREVEDGGSPLIEGDPDRPGISIVTFLWRALEPLDNVVAIELMTPGELPDKQLRRLGDSDVWYRSVRAHSNLRTVYQLAQNDSLVPYHEETDWESRHRNWRLDPLNPRRFKDTASLPEAVRGWVTSSVLELPDAPPLVRPLHDDRPLRGSLSHHRITSEILGNERAVHVYVPRGAFGSSAAPGLIVHFDGETAVGVMDLPQLIDDLVETVEIPPYIAVMVDNVDRNSELPCNRSFSHFLATELVPWVRREFGASDDPRLAIAAGQSYGGLAAAYAALQQPNVFGNVLSQSGSFWWGPDFAGGGSSGSPLPGEAPAFSWLNAEIATAARAPVRFWMEAGTLEDHLGFAGAPTLLHSNRHLRDVLVAKGYDVAYQEYPGGHDYIWWRETIADGLRALCR